MAIQHMSEFADQSAGDDGVGVFVAELDVPGHELVAARAILSASELERAGRFVFEKDRNRYIVARATLREILGVHLDVAPEMLEFSYGPYGKPALASQPAEKDLRFNVSHSGSVAVFAFANGLDVGVDVEALTPLDDQDDVAAHCFSDAEQRLYHGLREEDRKIEPYRAPMIADFEKLQLRRQQTDAQICQWANEIDSASLMAPYEFVSVMYGKSKILPRYVLVMHLFTHKTHHCGQVTTLLSQLGHDVGITDLPWVPDTAS